MYCNITYRHNRVTTVTVEKQVALNIMCVCVCVFVCVCITTLVFQNANHILSVPYCHLWPAWFYHIFPHYLIYGMNFG